MCDLRNNDAMPSLLPLALRQPADASFLARRLAAIAWGEGPPSPRSRAWLVETCRAELEWADAEWRRLAGDPDERAWGADPRQAWWLPHEYAAARVVNCHLHLDTDLWQLRKLRPRLRGQRRAATDGTLDAARRLYWADAAARTLDDYRGHLARRRLAWRCFVPAAVEYRRRRALIDKANLLLAA